MCSVGPDSLGTLFALLYQERSPDGHGLHDEQGDVEA